MRAVPSAIVLAVSLLAAGSGLAQTMSPPPSTLGSLPPATAPQPGAPPPSQPPPTPGSYLEAARLDIIQGHLDDASVALEEAETRILTRSVVRSPQVQPSNQPLVAMIAQARSALAASDRAGAIAKIDEALKSPDLNAPTQ